MPFLNKRVLDVRGKRVVIDNPIAPPPMMSNPSRRTSMRGHRQSFDNAQAGNWYDRFGLDRKACSPLCQELPFVNLDDHTGNQ